MNRKYVDKKHWVSNSSRKRLARPTEDEVDQHTDTWKDAIKTWESARIIGVAFTEPIELVDDTPWSPSTTHRPLFHSGEDASIGEDLYLEMID
jgi:hypothetical protein